MRFRARTVVYGPLARSFGSTGRATSILENSGRNVEMGSRNWKRPSSQSIIAATEAIGFVMDAIRKITSSAMGDWLSRSR